MEMMQSEIMSVGMAKNLTSSSRPGTMVPE
jgi:hypothetical protein